MIKKNVKESLTKLVKSLLDDFIDRHPSQSYQSLYKPVKYPVFRENGDGWELKVTGILDWNEIVKGLWGYFFDQLPDKKLAEEFVKEVEYFGGQEIFQFSVDSTARILANIFSNFDESWLSGNISLLAPFIDKEVDDILTKKRVVHVYYLLSGLELDSPFIYNNHEIIPLTNEGLKNLYINGQLSGDPFSKEKFIAIGDKILKSNSFLKSTFVVDWNDSRLTSEENLNEADSIIDLLRFIHPTMIAVTAKYMGYDSSIYEPTIFDGDSFSYANNAVKFNKEECFKFVEVFVKKRESIKKLEFVIERIKEITRRPTNINFDIFDYTSIAESLVVGGNTGEFSFRVPLHMTNLTQSEYSTPPRERYDLFRRCYTIRSLVAHCSEVKAKHQISNEDVKHLKDTVHTLLIKSLEQGLDALRDNAVNLCLKGCDV